MLSSSIPKFWMFSLTHRLLMKPCVPLRQSCVGNVIQGRVEEK
jgi:hypothetical protein